MTTEASKNSSAVFDLIYVETAEGRTMSCGVMVGDDASLIGPFPAKDSGPAIVDALIANPAFGFADRRAAEMAYMATHFRNMARGENDAGQAYPWRLPSAAITQATQDQGGGNV